MTPSQVRSSRPPTSKTSPPSDDDVQGRLLAADTADVTPQFWEIIDRTRNEEGDRASQAAALVEELTGLGTDAVLDFSRAFDTAMDMLYTWDLWGAAYLAMGGCGDDSFEYFRAWLIADGEVTTSLGAQQPEFVLKNLLGESADPGARWAELKVHEGEEILYAAGTAHERLTGSWLPSRQSGSRQEPEGRRWDEDDLPGRFPDLFSALPEEWWGGDVAEPGAELGLMVRANRGIAAFTGGDHETAAEMLDPLIDDGDAWKAIRDVEGLRIDVAYIAGIVRLQRGDVEGASAALHLVESDIPDADHVRRALAQVELARGDLEEAARFIVDSPEASRLDRVLAAKLAWRIGDTEGAVSRARQEMTSSLEPGEHVWDVAGAILQIGRILADAGETDEAEMAARAMSNLLADAPEDLPLLIHLRLLLASVVRLQGLAEDAVQALDELRLLCEGSDLGECLRERARSLADIGRTEDSLSTYREAVEVFDNAGERWEADATRREVGD